LSGQSKKEKEPVEMLASELSAPLTSSAVVAAVLLVALVTAAETHAAPRDACP